MDDTPYRDSPRWPRWAARGALLAAFVCFAMNCVFMHFTRNRPPNETLLLNQLVGWGSMAVVVAGIAAAAAALAGGWKEQSRETLLLAVLGLVLNVGIVLVTLWMLYVIRQARG